MLYPRGLPPSSGPSSLSLTILNCAEKPWGASHGGRVGTPGEANQGPHAAVTTSLGLPELQPEGRAPVPLLLIQT